MNRDDMKSGKRIMTARQIDRAVARIAHQIIEEIDDLSRIAVVGIHTRGVPLAKRIVAKIEEVGDCEICTGEIDITLYRDDFFNTLPAPRIGKTEFTFNARDYHVILVDDVLYTGRTVRAAIDAIMDYGRPPAIRFAVLIDRGHRELPIQADFVGRTVQTSREDAVAVFLSEIDDVDTVTMECRD